MPDVRTLEERAREAEAAGLAVHGVSKSGGASASAGIGGLVLVTSHGFHGATIGSRHGISMTAIAGDGTGMERDYDFSSTLHASDLENARDHRPPRRRARGQTPQSAQGHDPPRAGGVRFADFRIDRRTPRQRRQRQLDRAQDQFLAREARRKRSLPPASISSTIRCGRAACGRGRSTPRASPAASVIWSRTACSRPGSWIAPRRANLSLETTGHAQRGVSSTPSPGPSNLHMTPGGKTPGRTHRRHRRRLLRHRHDRHGRQSGHRRLQPRRIGLLDRERRAAPIRSAKSRSPGIFRKCSPSLVPANDLVFRYGTNAPTLRIEGMTVAGQ